MEQAGDTTGLLSQLHALAARMDELDPQPVDAGSPPRERRASKLRRQSSPSLIPPPRRTSPGQRPSSPSRIPSPPGSRLAESELARRVAALEQVSTGRAAAVTDLQEGLVALADRLFAQEEASLGRSPVTPELRREVAAIASKFSRSAVEEQRLAESRAAELDERLRLADGERDQLRAAVDQLNVDDKRLTESRASPGVTERLERLESECGLIDQVVARLGAKLEHDGELERRVAGLAEQVKLAEGEREQLRAAVDRMSCQLRGLGDKLQSGGGVHLELSVRSLGERLAALHGRVESAEQEGSAQHEAVGVLAEQVRGWEALQQSATSHAAVALGEQTAGLSDRLGLVESQVGSVAALQSQLEVLQLQAERGAAEGSQLAGVLERQAESRARLDRIEHDCASQAEELSGVRLALSAREEQAEGLEESRLASEELIARAEQSLASELGDHSGLMVNALGEQMEAIAERVQGVESDSKLIEQLAAGLEAKFQKLEEDVDRLAGQKAGPLGGIVAQATDGPGWTASPDVLMQSRWIYLSACLQGASRTSHELSRIRSEMDSLSSRVLASSEALAEHRARSSQELVRLARSVDERLESGYQSGLQDSSLTLRVDKMEESVEQQEEVALLYGIDNNRTHHQVSLLRHQLNSISQTILTLSETQEKRWEHDTSLPLQAIGSNGAQHQIPLLRSQLASISQTLLEVSEAQEKLQNCERRELAPQVEQLVNSRLKPLNNEVDSLRAQVATLSWRMGAQARPGLGILQ